MKNNFKLFMPLIVAVLSPFQLGAEDLSLLPKYGLKPKSPKQILADQEFIAYVGRVGKGDRVKAALQIATEGWQALQSNDAGKAMRRFNQAWLLNPKCGEALWGMGAVESLSGTKLSIDLFNEAEPYFKDNLNFEVDYAKALGRFVAVNKNKAQLTEAYARFAQIQKNYPDRTDNLENWAITAFYIEDYKTAWDKIILIEQQGKASTIDLSFIKALELQSPRQPK